MACSTSRHAGLDAALRLPPGVSAASPGSPARSLLPCFVCFPDWTGWRWTRRAGPGWPAHRVAGVAGRGWAARCARRGGVGRQTPLLSRLRTGAGCWLAREALAALAVGRGPEEGCAVAAGVQTRCGSDCEPNGLCSGLPALRGVGVGVVPDPTGGASAASDRDAQPAGVGARRRSPRPAQRQGPEGGATTSAWPRWLRGGQLDCAPPQPPSTPRPADALRRVPF